MTPRADDPFDGEDLDVPADATGTPATDAGRLGDDSPVDDVLTGGDEELAALLGAISSRLTTAPDELTARRHLKAMRQARGRGMAFRVAQRTGTAAAVAMVVGGLLAGGGLLPDDVQREVANAAAQVGIELPRPDSAEAEADRAGNEPAEGSERETAETEPSPARPDRRSEAPGDADEERGARIEHAPAPDADHGPAAPDRSGDDRAPSIVELPDVGQADEEPGEDRSRPGPVPIEPPLPPEMGPQPEDRGAEERQRDEAPGGDARQPSERGTTSPERSETARGQEQAERQDRSPSRGRNAPGRDADEAPRARSGERAGSPAP